ncbi:dTDP-glucose 4,6-dehydratase [Candidatus Peregrinibacteria bacterium CG11_big_fil_rev_8_21_14_0_20_41_10]|nr:MAG: dTDP-glucose 4,6-dehydratase [Candidatus Peregrinibacteria bacterium CG11_big_fil_rev_8_21_14_0_20_41_10]PJC38263.1 MAG: dTDP-glucose 4,6-dehydratase [Candidatus Peregrinibacteria bacterium CG_4_9_14_0_2_um_filter_41_14]
MKVLITGGAGFIGTNYVYYHLDKYPEDEIVVLDKLTYAGNLENIQPLLDENKIRFIKGDIADWHFIDKFFSDEKFNLVINFAAETHVDHSIENPHIFVETNIVGTHNLLRASLDNKVDRYHQISTDEVYGDLGDGSEDFFREDTPLDPNPPYAASKAAADLLVNSYYITYKMPVTISRCSNNYGPYQYPEKLVPYFFRLATQDKPLPVYGDGLNIRDWLYVGDHCEAIDLIIRKGRLGQVYNIGGHNEKTNLEITEHILKFLDKPLSLMQYVEDRKAHDRRYAMDPTKIVNELGWQPKVNFDQGLALTFDWYQNNRDWWEPMLAKANRIE